jgi:hypothetical protein
MRSGSRLHLSRHRPRPPDAANVATKLAVPVAHGVGTRTLGTILAPAASALLRRPLVVLALIAIAGLVLSSDAAGGGPLVSPVQVSHGLSQSFWRVSGELAWLHWL